MKRSETSAGVAEWKLEPELAGPIPRRVVARWGYLPMAVLLSFALLGLGLWFYAANLPASAVAASAVAVSLLLFGLLFLNLGVPTLFYVCNWQERRLARLLVSSGTAARGIIAECIRNHVQRFGSDFNYLITYHTPAQRNISVSFVGMVPRNPWGFNGREVGDTLTVLYFPEAPEKALLYKDCYYKAVASQT